MQLNVEDIGSRAAAVVGQLVDCAVGQLADGALGQFDYGTGTVDGDAVEQQHDDVNNSFDENAFWAIGASSCIFICSCRISFLA